MVSHLGYILPILTLIPDLTLPMAAGIEFMPHLLIQCLIVMTGTEDTRTFADGFFLSVTGICEGRIHRNNMVVGISNDNALAASLEEQRRPIVEILAAATRLASRSKSSNAKVMFIDITSTNLIASSSKALTSASQTVSTAKGCHLRCLGKCGGRSPTKTLGLRMPWCSHGNTTQVIDDDCSIFVHRPACGASAFWGVGIGGDA